MEKDYLRFENDAKMYSKKLRVTDVWFSNP